MNGPANEISNLVKKYELKDNMLQINDKIYNIDKIIILKINQVFSIHILECVEYHSGLLII